MRLELTKRGDYAVRAMLALVRGNPVTATGPNGPNGSVGTAGSPGAVGAAGSGHRLLSARRIADAMSIPVRFLPQVLADLQRAGLVEAAPGRSGGYRLSKPPTEISLLDVVEAVEGDSRRRTCVLRGGPCGLDGHCDVHDVFFEGQEALRGAFAKATLADLAAPATVAALAAHPTD